MDENSGAPAPSSTPSSPRPPMSSTNDSSTCHILPCKIDYTGPAAVDVYFRPTPIPPKRPGRHITVSNDEYKMLLNGSIPSTTSALPRGVDFDAEDNLPTFQAAQFRGHGLLAPYPPEPVQACVLTLNTTGANSSNSTVAAVVEKQVPVTNISEWQHEHQESVVLRAHKNGRGRVARGLEFCRIAAALHGPCAIPPDGP